MTTDDFSPLPPEEKPNVAALVLSATVHLLLIGALFFGVQWRSQAPSGVAVEVWRSAPGPVAVAKPEPAPTPPPPPKPEPQPQPKPEPKPEPKVEPTPPVKPDITVKEEKKKEEPKKPEPKPEPKKEEPKKPEPKKEEPKKPEPKKEESKKPEPKPEPRDFSKDIDQELKAAQQKKAAAQAAQSRNDALEAEFSQIGQMKGAQAAAGRKAGEDKYIAALRQKIRGNIVLPPSINGNPEAEFKITQLPSGEVIGVRVSKSSGNRALDEAIERAIKKSDPLPLPDDPKLFQRELNLKYRPFAE